MKEGTGKTKNGVSAEPAVSQTCPHTATHHERNDHGRTAAVPDTTPNELFTNQATTTDMASSSRAEISSAEMAEEKTSSGSEHSSSPMGREIPAFSRLVRRWESYIGERQVEEFQPLQMLQNLRLYGTGTEVPGITSGLSMATQNQNRNYTSDANNANANVNSNQIATANSDVSTLAEDHTHSTHSGNAAAAAAAAAGVDGGNVTTTEPDPFETIMLRHTHSTPLQFRTSMFRDGEVDGDGNRLPGPSPLDMRRSSSTPMYTSAFRQHSSKSAFGTHLRSMPHLNGPDDRSAFSLPSHRASFAMSDSGVRYSAFDPVPLAAATSTTETEDTTMKVNATNHQGRCLDGEKKCAPKSKSTSSRTARFFSDIRRKRRGRGGRDNPAHPLTCTSQEDANGKKDGIKVKTSPPALYESKKRESDLEDAKVDATLVDQYHQLDSDADEECAHYQRIETSILAGSPASIPSPSYQSLDDRPGNAHADSTLTGVRIQVSNATKAPAPTDRNVHQSDSFSSPTLFQTLCEGINLTPRSIDSGRTLSPGTATRSSLTTSTSGHTTHATSTTTSSGHTSGLSSISETDREVMETIKEGKRRRQRTSRKNDADGTSIHSQSTTSTANDGYVALVGSPLHLREGANVPADRFFTTSQTVSTGSPGVAGSLSSYFRSRNPLSSTIRGVGSNNSPVTSSTSSMANTSSSVSTVDEPPNFVSYIDREHTSDLTSVREATENFRRSSRGGGLEEREDSPAEIVGYSDVTFEEAKAPSEVNTALQQHLDCHNEQQQPKPVRPVRDRLRGRLDRFRSRPPLSPIKGSRVSPTTPPPGSGSPAYNQLSPPRNIVDHRIEPNVSRPYVVRRNPSGHKLVLVSPDSGGGTGPFQMSSATSASTASDGTFSNHHFINNATSSNMGFVYQNTNHPNYPSYNNWTDEQRPYNNQTYQEHSVEIMKSDSKDEMTSSRFISPEKDTESS